VDVVVKLHRRTIAFVWPADTLVFSEEACSGCKQKTLYYITSQNRSGDEEADFFAKCTVCQPKN